VVVRGADEQRQLVAYVTAAAGATIAGEALRQWLTTEVPEYMVPAAVVVLAAWPLTPNGKIDRAALPAPPAARAPTGRAPATPAECTLAAIWCAVLRRDQVSADDNFFALGGDSILSIQVVTRASQRGLGLTPRDVFQHQTLAALAAAVTTLGAPAIAAAPGAGEPVPLAPLQRWLLAGDAAHAAHFTHAVVLRVAGPLHAAAWRAAVTALVAQHAGLRLRFADGDTATTVAEEPARVLIGIDGRAVPAAAQPAWWRTVVTALQRSLDLGAGPLLRVAVLTLADGEVRVVVIVHHAVMDAVSWGPLLADLTTAYGQAARGAPVTLGPPPVAFQSWLVALARYGARPAVQAQAPYWRGVLAASGPLPRDGAGGPARVGSARRVRLTLGEAATRALIEGVPRGWGQRTEAALLTALGEALTTWSGAPAHVVALEGHGREDALVAPGLAVSRMVGWCTSVYPVRLTGRAGTRWAPAVARTATMLQAIPDKGLGYGWLRWGPAAPLAALSEPAISFNYLGQGDSVLRGEAGVTLAHEWAGPTRAADAPRRYALEINAQTWRGQLHVRVAYSPEWHRADTIERFAATLQAALTAIADEVASPDRAELPADDLAGVLAELRAAAAV
jgi:non-ribosomal peptide synthase protein (TIGR01720 family)